jgi:hypothetical protein
MSSNSFSSFVKPDDFLDQPIKVLAPDLLHRGFQYQHGLNIDRISFSEASPCGLHFTTLRFLPLFMSFGTKMANVTIPPHQRVVKKNDARPPNYAGKIWKAEQIILSNIIDIQDHPCWYDRKFCDAAVQMSGLSVKYIRELTYLQALQAVKNNGLALQYLRFQTEELCYFAVAQNSEAFQFVINQTEKLCVQAIQLKSSNIMWVKNQTPEMCYHAVKDNGMNLRYIRKQTFELCVLAVHENYAAFQYVEKQQQHVRSQQQQQVGSQQQQQQSECLCLSPEQLETIGLIAVWNNPQALRFVSNQTERMCIEAVKNDGISLILVHEQTEDICAAAVRADPFALHYVKNTGQDLLDVKSKANKDEHDNENDNENKDKTENENKDKAENENEDKAENENNEKNRATVCAFEKTVARVLTPFDIEQLVKTEKLEARNAENLLKMMYKE